MSVGEAESMARVAFCVVFVKYKVVAKRESGISAGPAAGVSSLAARPQRSEGSRAKEGCARKHSRHGGRKLVFKFSQLARIEVVRNLTER
ncbi:hypothetical protein CEXT_121361 [Caerostris extrusa]|uniref:Uncharacterized protein n=1 Tax=Caerostris extrusa TaxID=172846 RepID=A0AAV4TR61_CAEEX|nr:hypothetical protein CEXT_121361 [Caerostris extrusa]